MIDYKYKVPTCFLALNQYFTGKILACLVKWSDFDEYFLFGKKKNPYRPY